MEFGQLAEEIFGIEPNIYDLVINLTISNANIDGLVQERRNSSALAMELRLSCINPSV